MSTQPELQLNAEQASYYQQRMATLGILPEYNTIYLHSPLYDPATKNLVHDVPIFRESPAGIDILVYGLDRYVKRTHKKLERVSGDVNATDKPYMLTRLWPEIVKKDGSKQKYSMPKGEPTYPFFPPVLVKKYDEGTTIPVLYITEGYFKAFKACMHGIDCVGVPSITCLKDTTTGAMHGDILKLIDKCRVERLVWLTDGDCRSLSTSELTEGKDLSRRPKNFFNTIITFYELVSKLDVIKYFAHINSDELSTREGERIIKAGPKGLDDLLCEFSDRIEDIAQDFHDYNHITGNGIYKGSYLTRINISHNTIRINQYFLLNDVDRFYQYHSELRKDFKELKTFKYNGTLYRYDEKEGKCIVEIPSSAADYIRVGNDYYQHIMYPDKWNKLHKGLDARIKSTILDDNEKYGKAIFKHIQKFHRFVVVPNHVDYQQVTNNCWNLYNPFIHEPEEGECPITLNFIKHIFGTELVKDVDDKTGKVTEIPRYELGLDYLTILYKYPQQILPILCLVSRERQTGKTTFINWLDKLFAENVITIGNEDMQQDFNSHWVSKLIICCDETKLDKHEVIQKIKRLSTADKIVMNSKGKDQVTLEFFAKFILISNDEEDFIRIDKDEIRFWVNKVPQLPQVNKDMLQEMMDEIPAFLHYLARRQMVTTNQERHWFKTDLLRTKALDAVKENSMSTAEKRIRLEIKEWFAFTGLPRLTFPLHYLSNEVVKGIEKTYLVKVLHRMGYKSTNGRGQYPIKETTLVKAEQQVVGQEPLHEITYKMIGFNTTHYEFFRENFMDNEDPQQPEATVPAGNVTKDDLPF